MIAWTWSAWPFDPTKSGNLSSLNDMSGNLFRLVGPKILSIGCQISKFIGPKFEHINSMPAREEPMPFGSLSIKKHLYAGRTQLTWKHFNLFEEIQCFLDECLWENDSRAPQCPASLRHRFEQEDALLQRFEKLSLRCLGFGQCKFEIKSDDLLG